MNTVELDDLDRQLIELLGENARVSNRKIAADLGITEGTVRARIKRLQQERLIAFTAITDFGLERSAKMAMINIDADVHRVREIADEIAKVSFISAVMITMGRHNIVAFCVFEQLDSLFEVASETILTIPGVHHVETAIAVKTLKYNARVVRITGPSGADDEADDLD